MFKICKGQGWLIQGMERVPAVIKAEPAAGREHTSGPLARVLEVLMFVNPLSFAF